MRVHTKLEYQLIDNEYVLLKEEGFDYEGPIAQCADVKRNLEANGGLYINRFWTGVVSNRSPLFVPISVLGIQVIQRQDVLWSGFNIMLTPQSTLKRRYGFLRYCPTAFGANEWPLTYFSFQNLAGTVDDVVDTQTHVYTFTTSSKTAIYTKMAGSGQSSFQDVANVMYWCDGISSLKFINGVVQNLGIVAPVTAPTLSYVSNGTLNPLIGYQYGYSFVNGTTDHPSTMSPASANTGPLTNQTIVESTVTVSVTSTAIASDVLTVVTPNNFEPGQSVTFLGMTYATWLNGETVTVVTSSSSQFTAAFTNANYGTTAEASGATAKMTLSIPNASPYQYTVSHANTFLSDGGVVYSVSSVALVATTGVPTTGQYSVTGGVYTFAVADINLGIEITYTYALANSTGINVQVGGDYSPDSQVTLVNIWRTDDGGAVYYLDAQIPNVVGTGTWSYVDSTPDAQLNSDIIAPVADQNAPPPAGITILCWYAGRLWAASGNTLYFSGGPDTVNGVGEEAWPPGNNYTVPGNITGLLPTNAGLVIFTQDNAYGLTGTSSATFTTPALYQANWGIANPNCIAQDGQNLFIYTTQNQLLNVQNSSSLSTLSYAIQDQLEGVNPSSVYIAVHRNGLDEGVFVSDGNSRLWRYSQVSSAWDPVYNIQGGIGAITSMEMGDFNWRLLMGRSTGSGYILDRDTTTFSDDTVTYSAQAIIGSLTVSPPRGVANIESVLIQMVATGTYPKLSVLCNEIKDTGKFPATFVALPNPQPDPPQLPPTSSIWTRRHDFKSAQAPLSNHVSHMQIKLDFIAEAAANELFGIGLAPVSQKPDAGAK